LARVLGRYDEEEDVIFVYMKRHAEFEDLEIIRKEIEKTIMHELIHTHKIYDEDLVESLTCLLCGDYRRHEHYSNDVDLEFLIVDK